MAIVSGLNATPLDSIEAYQAIRTINEQAFDNTDDIDLVSGKVFKIDGTQVVGAQGATIADLATTWTANPRTATGSITIADGDTPTVEELGQYCVELEAKLELVLARLKAHGLIA